MPAVRAPPGKAVSARLVQRAKVRLAGLAVKAHRVDSVRPVGLERVDRVLPRLTLLEVDSVRPADLERVDRVLPLPILQQVASVLQAGPVQVDRGPAKAVSVRQVPGVRLPERPKSHPPRPPDPPVPGSIASPASAQTGRSAGVVVSGIAGSRDCSRRRGAEHER